MKTSGNTVFISGGSAGIGLAIAKKLSAAGNKIIINGRNEERLQKALKELPKPKSGQLHSASELQKTLFPSASEKQENKPKNGTLNECFDQQPQGTGRVCFSSVKFFQKSGGVPNSVAYLVVDWHIRNASYFSRAAHTATGSCP